MQVSTAEQQQEVVGQEQLWEWFVVVGLPNKGLQTIHGEHGFLGTDHKYKPTFADSLPHSTFDGSCRLPPQLPTVGDDQSHGVACDFTICICPSPLTSGFSFFGLLL